MDGRLCSLVALVTVALGWTHAQSQQNNTREAPHQTQRNTLTGDDLVEDEVAQQQRLLAVKVSLNDYESKLENSALYGRDAGHCGPVFQCGGHLVTDSGFVASEGFPNHYKPNSKCTWYITVPAGHVVMLSFRLLDIEADATCRYDYLDVYNGHTRLVQKLGRFCGTFRPGALIATSNTMMLHMASDAATAGRGFVAYFSAGKPHVEENQFCGGRLTKEQGSVRTPNWPNSDYPAGISCSWHISVEPSNVSQSQRTFHIPLYSKGLVYESRLAPCVEAGLLNQVIEVKFSKLDLEPDTYCRYDYVAFFNGGERDDSRRIGKYCGDRVPGTIVTNSNELLVQFVSDLSVTSDGFMAFYTSVPRGSRAPTPGGDFIYSPHTVTRTQRPASKPTPRPARLTPKPRPGAVRPKPTARAPPVRPRPSPRTPARRPGAKPSAKPKAVKPTARPKVAKPKAKPTAKPKAPKPSAKSTAKPRLKLKPKATPKPKFNKFKPMAKPGARAKSTAKPPKAKAKVKPTGKPLAKPVRPTPKVAVKPGTKPNAKPAVKPTKPPKGKPKVLAKPGQGKTTTKKPGLIKKLLPAVNPQCNQACKRTGTLQSNFCPHDFVIAGRVTSLTPGARGSVAAEVTLIKAYKTGSLKLLKAGPVVSVQLSSSCRRCPELKKGLNYVLMGKVDSQGSGLLTPSSFSLLYKPVHAKALAIYAQQSC
ncbi:Procollagen C-endopeptidase enhancer 2 [Merluccius polli]|uniref:Procollagen C-endopeptidase enhancer 2 n=1 Tax=Merluccius polli TaxID=89951 RepID=A0AA47M5I5_MERPO|nr:Procollagen C-endopeptidase enhancer 2 [Merluccius polli]